jgi:hypothetical protein
MPSTRIFGNFKRSQPGKFQLAAEKRIASQSVWSRAFGAGIVCLGLIYLVRFPDRLMASPSCCLASLLLLARHRRQGCHVHNNTLRLKLWGCLSCPP